MSDRAQAAAERLATALYELGYRGRISLKPDVRVILGTGTPDNPALHGVGLPAEVVELMAEAIEQLLIRIDTEAPSQPSGAALFTEAHPDLATELTDTFNGLDLVEITRAVLEDTDPCDRMTVTRAIDAMFGDCATEDEDENGDER
ncbi:hypothetical protein AB0454_35595 [Streptomyces sp. NPDC093509]|uniref:hypothetical protein n=1 Tax=Streptomyces sp. NPDC093509 TaxID=3154982 RepID=UPI00344D6D59